MGAGPGPVSQASSIRAPPETQPDRPMRGFCNARPDAARVAAKTARPPCPEPPIESPARVLGLHGTGGLRWRPTGSVATEGTGAIAAGSPRWTRRSSGRSRRRAARPAPGCSAATTRASSPAAAATPEARPRAPARARAGPAADRAAGSVDGREARIAEAGYQPGNDEEAQGDLLVLCPALTPQRDTAWAASRSVHERAPLDARAGAFDPRGRGHPSNGRRRDAGPRTGRRSEPAVYASAMRLQLPGRGSVAHP